MTIYVEGLSCHQKRTQSVGLAVWAPSVRAEPVQYRWSTHSALHVKLAAVAETSSFCNKGQARAGVKYSDSQWVCDALTTYLPWWSMNLFCNANPEPLCYQSN